MREKINETAGESRKTTGCDRERLKGQLNGSITLEAAFVFPVMFLLIMFLILFGFAVHDRTLACIFQEAVLVTDTADGKDSADSGELTGELRSILFTADHAELQASENPVRRSSVLRVSGSTLFPLVPGLRFPWECESRRECLCRDPVTMLRMKRMLARKGEKDGGGE